MPNARIYLTLASSIVFLIGFYLFHVQLSEFTVTYCLTFKSHFLTFHIPNCKTMDKHLLLVFCLPVKDREKVMKIVTLQKTCKVSYIKQSGISKTFLQWQTWNCQKSFATKIGQLVSSWSLCMLGKVSIFYEKYIFKEKSSVFLLDLQ